MPEIQACAIEGDILPLSLEGSLEEQLAQLKRAADRFSGMTELFDHMSAINGTAPRVVTGQSFVHFATGGNRENVI